MTKGNQIGLTKFDIFVYIVLYNYLFLKQYKISVMTMQKYCVKT